jgi:phosphoribosylaminoimidazole carboxylase (NCAIR synthetase)
VTFEFENVSAAAAAAARRAPSCGRSGHALQIAQHRVREKTFLADHGLPVTPFASVQSEAELQAALERIGCPSVLKTSTLVRRQGQMPIVAAGGARRRGTRSRRGSARSVSRSGL